jgi:hypothetical protein
VSGVVWCGMIDTNNNDKQIRRSIDRSMIKREREGKIGTRRRRERFTVSQVLIHIARKEQLKLKTKLFTYPYIITIF